MSERKVCALIDTCVFLDAILQRKNFQESANAILKLVNTEKINGYISTQSIPTLYFYIRKFTHNEKQARQIIAVLLEQCCIISTTGKDCLWALQSPSSDYEDAILTETAAREKLDLIITRDRSGFKKSLLPVMTPKEFLKKYQF